MLALKLGKSLPSTGGGLNNIYSLDFNGTDEYVTADTVAGDMSVATGTISMWVKIDTTSATRTMFQARTDSNNYVTLFYHAGTNQGRFTYRAGGTTDTVNFADAIEGDTKWHHIAATWDVDADEIKIYLDGVAKDDTSSLGTWSGAMSLCDIAQDTTGNKYFLGNITEVGVFTRVVPIGELFIANRQPVDLTGSTELVGYWKFDEGSGTVAADSSGKGNTGTLNNTPTWSTDVPYKAG
jgi:hypothetical protein